MASLVELKEGDILVIRRANPNPPFEGELESLSQLASDAGLAGVLVLGVDETIGLIDDDRLRDLGLMRIPAADRDWLHGDTARRRVAEPTADPERITP